MFSCYHVCVPLPGSKTSLLEDVTFEIEEGRWAEIVGPSGAGKSALFSLIALEARPPEGRLVVAGRNLDRLGCGDFAELRRQFGTCRQSPEFLEDRTVLENLALPLVVRGDSERAAERGEALLERGELLDRRDVEARNLAVGERKLLAVLRAAVGAPDAVVVDGVLAELDGVSRRVAEKILEDVHRQGSTVVIFGPELSGAGPEDVESFRLEGGAIQRMET